MIAQEIVHWYMLENNNQYREDFYTSQINEVNLQIKHLDEEMLKRHKELILWETSAYFKDLPQDVKEEIRNINAEVKSQLIASQEKLLPQVKNIQSVWEANIGSEIFDLLSPAKALFNPELFNLKKRILFIDIEKEILAVGGELHADAESKLLDEGSKQTNLWGFNIYFGKSEDERIQYTSLINIKPRQGNRSLEIGDASLRVKIKAIVDKRVKK